MKYKVEVFDIWQYLCGKYNNYVPQIRCRIALAGRIDAQVLKQAVTLSLKTIPLIGYCFDGQSDRPRWIKKGFTGEDMVYIVEGEKDEENQILRCLSSEIDFAVEPQLKIIVVRGAGGDTLCAVITHIICDGAGFKQYLYLLSELYTKLLNGAELPVQVFYQRGAGLLYTSISLRDKICILYSCFKPSSFQDNPEQRGIDFKNGETGLYMERRTLSKEVFAAFKAFLKENGATVNDGLMALFARAFCKNTNTESIQLPSTMDLRKFIPKGKKYGISNYSGMCMCNIPVGQGDSLAKTIARVSKQMLTYKTGNDILKYTLMSDYAAHITSYRQLRHIYPEYIKYPIIGYTNIGIINAEALKFDNLPVKEAYLTSAIRRRPALQLNVSTYCDCCTLSFNIYGSQYERQFINRLLDDIYREVSGLLS